MIDKVLRKLIYAKTPSDIKRILTALGDVIEWVPLGNNYGNYGIISMGSDPFNGITERITNSMDAMIEFEVESITSLRDCKDPREAVERIYGFNEGNLRWCEQEQIGRLAKNIKVKFLDSGIRPRPTVDVWDRGIGQHPSDFPDTLVSLNSNYKVSKLYLIGAFGQGGQTSFGHCEYGVIISRKCPNLLRQGQSDVVGWTIVRYQDPSTPEVIHKIGFWEYCVDSRTGEVPEASPSALPIALEHGTIVRLVAYDLLRGTSDVLQPASTAWSYLSQSLFDSVLPFRLYEERKRFQRKNRSFAGLARRLWRGGKGAKMQIVQQDSYDIDMGSDGSVRLNYWAMEPIQEQDSKTRWKDIKKGYVSRNDAVFLTLNGQRHGIETTTFLRDRVNLPYAHDYIIVQVDCDKLTNLAKKQIFSSTRDRLRESELKHTVMQEVAEHLGKDRNILAFERTRKNAIISRKTMRDTSRIRSIVAKYIAKNPELSALIKKGDKEKYEAKKSVHEPKDDEKEEEDEIRENELEVPELKEIPTYLRITNASDPIPVEKGGNALIRLETDAVDTFLKEPWSEKLRIFHHSGITREKSSSGLRCGKISYRIYCPSSVRVGTREMISFDLDLPDGSSLHTDGEVKCIKPKKRKKKKVKRKLPEPRIEPVSKTDDLWNLLDFDENSVGKIYLEANPAIYISLDNRHLKAALSDKRLSDETVVDSVKDRYVAAVAYHLLLMHVDRIIGKHTTREDSEISEEREEKEKERLAKTASMLALPIDAL